MKHLDVHKKCASTESPVLTGPAVKRFFIHFTLNLCCFHEQYPEGRKVELPQVAWFSLVTHRHTN